MTRHPAALALLALLAACQKSEPEPNEVASNLSEPSANVATAPEQPAPGALPPADANLRFVGTWAAEPGLCQQGAWRFTERGLSTAGEVSCDFDRINPVPGGYDLTGSCTAEGEETRNTIRLRFAEPTRSMMVEADRILQPVGLIYCGPTTGG